MQVLRSKSNLGLCRLNIGPSTTCTTLQQLLSLPLRWANSIISWINIFILILNIIFIMIIILNRSILIEFIFIIKTIITTILSCFYNQEEEDDTYSALKGSPPQVNTIGAELIMYPYKDKTSDLHSNMAICLQEFLRTKSFI